MKDFPEFVYKNFRNSCESIHVPGGRVARELEVAPPTSPASTFLAIAGTCATEQLDQGLYRLCCIRVPKDILIGLAQELS